MPSSSAQRSHPSGGRRAVLVLGMHRSGTSALSRVANLLGATAPATLMPPNHENPEGYWESQVIYSLHEELLKAAGSSWHDWQAIDPGWLRTEAAARFRTRIKDALESEYSDAPLPVMKDPRICRLMTFWLELLEGARIKPVILTITRNPLEVAFSLKSRDGFLLEKSMLLWLRHVLEAEYHSRGLARSFLDHRDLLRDWKATLLRAGEQTGVAWPRLRADAETEINSFLRPQLHRARASDEDLFVNPSAPACVIAAYGLVARLSSNPEDGDAMGALDDIRRELDQACRTFGPSLRAHEKAAGQLGSDLMQRTLELEAAVARQTQTAEVLGRHQAERESVQQELSSASAQIVGLRDQIVTIQADSARQFEAANAAAAAALAAMRNRTMDAEAALEAKSRDLARIRNELATTRERTEHLASELGAADARVARLQTEMEIQRNELRTIRLSIGWRLTAPVREIGRRFPRLVHIARAGLRPIGRAVLAARPGVLLIVRSGMFDRAWYLARYPDVRSAGVDPVRHYLDWGAAEGRNPSPSFDTEWYASGNPDVRRAGLNPLVHYLRYGQREGRAPVPPPALGAVVAPRQS
jgi:hypothetical protein